jgi:hypothetical protein
MEGTAGAVAAGRFEAQPAAVTKATTIRRETRRIRIERPRDILE